jgi:hypothetical protein
MEWIPSSRCNLRRSSVDVSVEKAPLIKEFLRADCAGGRVVAIESDPQAWLVADLHMKPYPQSTKVNTVCRLNQFEQSLPIKFLPGRVNDNTLQAVVVQVDEHWIPCQGVEVAQGFEFAVNTHGKPNLTLGVNQVQLVPPVALNKSSKACISVFGGLSATTVSCTNATISNRSESKDEQECIMRQLRKIGHKLWR